MTRSPRTRDDEGATLLIVLAFLLSFALIVPALLTTAQTSVISIASTRDIGKRVIDASAAADTAVNALRNGVYDNVPGQPCFHDPADTSGTSDSSALTITGANTLNQALVTCQSDPNSGYPTTIRQTVLAPAAALLTTSTNASEYGIRQAAAANDLRVNGQIYSNSTIFVPNNNSSITDPSPIKARGSCTGAVLGNPTTCNDTSSDPLYTAPVYPLPTTVPPPATAPACQSTSASRAYTLSPGSYTSASALSNLTSGCANSLVYFSPGTYYFDFSDSTPLWQITGGYVVGGTPTGWSVSGFPTTPPPVPNACVKATDITGDNGGVMFVFGGASRMSVSSGARVDLCGAYDVSRPPIAIFGATTGSGPTSTTTTVPTDGTGTRDTGSDAAFATPANIKVKDTVTADAVLSNKTSVATGSVVVKLPYTAPTGAVLTSARVRVAHRDSTGPAVTTGSNTVPAGPVTSLDLKVKATASTTVLAPDAGSAALSLTPDASTSANSTTNVHEETLDFTNGLKPFFDAGFSGISATFKATSAINTSATERLDSIQLDLTYSVTAFRAENVSGSCTATAPYTGLGSGPCALVTTTGSSTRLYLDGTTYAPLAALDISLNNVTQQVFAYGLVCRVLVTSITSSASNTNPVISVPTATAAYAATVDLSVFLQVYLCPSGSCSTVPVPAPAGYVPPAGSGWVRRLSTRVAYHDTAYPPVAAQRQVGVKSWSNIR